MLPPVDAIISDLLLCDSPKCSLKSTSITTRSPSTRTATFCPTISMSIRTSHSPVSGTGTTVQTTPHHYKPSKSDNTASTTPSPEECPVNTPTSPATKATTHNHSNVRFFIATSPPFPDHSRPHAQPKTLLAPRFRHVVPALIPATCHTHRLIPTLKTHFHHIASLQYFSDLTA